MFIGHIIGGECNESAASSFTLVNPATGDTVGEAPVARTATVDAAYAAAGAALPGWRATTPAARQAALLALADLIVANVDEIVELEVLVTGKPRVATKFGEILRGADQLRFFAGLARTPQGLAQTEFTDGFTSSIRREPIGVVGQVTPWNYPFMMAIWKVAPALAAGNSKCCQAACSTSFWVTA